MRGFGVRRKLAQATRRLTGRTSWSVVSTVAEPTELLCAFVAHYLSLGASEVHLFLDDPDSAQIETLSRIKGVRLTICDGAHWARMDSHRPPQHVMRQLKNANLAYRQARSDWFLFCDADEFLLPTRPVHEILAEQPATLRHLRPRMAERAFVQGHVQDTLFSGVLRREIQDPEVLQQIYGDLAPMTTRGLLGHAVSKSFVRTGQDDLRIRIHFPVPHSRKEEMRLKAEGKLTPGPFMEDCWLVHFDGMTPLHWQYKLLRYYLQYAPLLDAGTKGIFKRRTPARSAQLNAIYEARGDAEELARLTGLMRLSQTRLEQLRAAGGLLDLPLDPVATARARVAPDLGFSAAAFDASLMARHGDVIAEHGLLQEAPG